MSSSIISFIKYQTKDPTPSSSYQKPKSQNQIAKEADLLKKDYVKRYDGDLLRFLSANISQKNFDDFGKIRNSLEGRDKSLYEMSALRGYSVIEDLNALFKYSDLSSIEKTAFLDAFSELDEDSMQKLIEIRKSYTGNSNEQKWKKYYLANSLSLLQGEDQNNFVKALAENSDSIFQLHTLTFSMISEDRTSFLAAAANTGSKLSKFLNYTQDLGKNFLKNTAMQKPLYLGISSSGKFTSLVNINKTGDVKLENKIYDNVLPPEKYLSNNKEEIELLQNFIKLAQKTGSSADNFMNLVDKFDFQEDKYAIFNFINSLSDKNAQNFTDAASGLELPDILKLMERTRSFSGKDKEYFLEASANADENYKRFLNILNKIGSDDSISKFLSAAAKSGENIGSFLDIISEVDNENLENLLNFMEDLSKDQAQKLLETPNVSAKMFLDLAKQIKDIDKKDKNILLDLVSGDQIDLEKFIETSEDKTQKEKQDFFAEIIETFHQEINTII